ncbi:hypothetical protein K7432_015718, partial [Basidiobolus ranarum]
PGKLSVPSVTKSLKYVLPLVKLLFVMLRIRRRLTKLRRRRLVLLNLRSQSNRLREPVPLLPLTVVK